MPGNRRVNRHHRHFGADNVAVQNRFSIKMPQIIFIYCESTHPARRAVAVGMKPGAFAEAEDDVVVSSADIIIVVVVPEKGGNDVPFFSPVIVKTNIFRRNTWILAKRPRDIFVCVR